VFASVKMEAERLAQKLDTHCTPKHGSWLNGDEIEIAALSARCPQPLKEE